MPISGANGKYTLFDISNDGSTDFGALQREYSSSSQCHLLDWDHDKSSSSLQLHMNSSSQHGHYDSESLLHFGEVHEHSHTQHQEQQQHHGNHLGHAGYDGTSSYYYNDPTASEQRQQNAYPVDSRHRMTPTKMVQSHRQHQHYSYNNHYPQENQYQDNNDDLDASDDATDSTPNKHATSEESSSDEKMKKTSLTRETLKEHKRVYKILHDSRSRQSLLSSDNLDEEDNVDDASSDYRYSGSDDAQEKNPSTEGSAVDFYSYGSMSGHPATSRKTTNNATRDPSSPLQSISPSKQAGKNDEPNTVTQPPYLQEPNEATPGNPSSTIQRGSAKKRKKVQVSVQAAPQSVMYNDRGYEICGYINQHNKPCQRIGTCPFHAKVKTTEGAGQSKEQSRKQSKPQESTTKKPRPKTPFKQGWTKEEHYKFLKGLDIFGRGSWKHISLLVGTRTATQIQSHAQKYFLRQDKPVKNKKSIHDFSIEELNDIIDSDTRTRIQEECDRQLKLYNEKKKGKRTKKRTVSSKNSSNSSRSNSKRKKQGAVEEERQSVPIPITYVAVPGPSGIVNHTAGPYNAETRNSNNVQTYGSNVGYQGENLTLYPHIHRPQQTSAHTQYLQDFSYRPSVNSTQSYPQQQFDSHDGSVYHSTTVFQQQQVYPMGGALTTTPYNESKSQPLQQQSSERGAYSHSHRLSGDYDVNGHRFDNYDKNDDPLQTDSHDGTTRNNPSSESTYDLSWNWNTAENSSGVQQQHLSVSMDSSSNFSPKRKFFPAHDDSSSSQL